MQEMIAYTQEALWLVLIMSGPPILVATAVGLVVAIAQAATQIQEQTLPQALKLIAIFLTVIVMAGFLSTAMITFGDRMFTTFAAESKKKL
jgi:type III secretion protein S